MGGGEEVEGLSEIISLSGEVKVDFSLNTSFDFTGGECKPGFTITVQSSGDNTNGVSRVVNEIGLANILIGNAVNKVTPVDVFHPASSSFLFAVSEEDSSLFATGNQMTFCICMKDDQSDIWWANIIAM